MLLLSSFLDTHVWDMVLPRVPEAYWYAFRSTGPGSTRMESPSGLGNLITRPRDIQFALKVIF